MEQLAFIAVLTVQSVKTQVENIKNKNWSGVAMFGCAMATGVALAFISKDSAILNVFDTQTLSTIDTVLYGLGVGFIATGGKDLINSIRGGY